MSRDRVRDRFVGGLLLIGITGALPGCGGYEPSHFEQVQERLNDAVTTLSAKGGSAVEKSYPQGKAWIVDLSDASIDDEVLRSLKSLGRVSELDLSGSTITDEQFASLATPETLGYLYKLDLSDTAVSDRGFVAAAPLPILSEINVKGSKVTDAGIAEFKKKHPTRNQLGLKLKIQT